MVFCTNLLVSCASASSKSHLFASWLLSTHLVLASHITLVRIMAPLSLCSVLSQPYLSATSVLSTIILSRLPSLLTMLSVDTFSPCLALPLQFSCPQSFFLDFLHCSPCSQSTHSVPVWPTLSLCHFSSVHNHSFSTSFTAHHALSRHIQSLFGQPYLSATSVLSTIILSRLPSLLTMLSVDTFSPCLANPISLPLQFCPQSFFLDFLHCSPCSQSTHSVPVWPTLSPGHFSSLEAHPPSALSQLSRLQIVAPLAVLL